VIKLNLKLLYNKHKEIVNYLIVGILTTIVSLGVKYLLLFTVLDAKDAFQLQVAVIISWICAVAFAYITNRVFVFESKSKHYFKEISAFVGGRILTLVMEMFIMWFFITFLKMDSKVWVITWTMVSQVLVTVLNYIISKFLVFVKKSD